MANPKQFKPYPLVIWCILFSDTKQTPKFYFLLLIYLFFDSKYNFLIYSYFAIFYPNLNSLELVNQTKVKFN